ncbi:uncharacterized protein FTJAE_11324 [Fusarium tjaetaba]|uniref:Uncharacterized protein n=1 Tax=Fusarium tjaetaba TaxID=1567544 RepID=A0A8H5QVI9_9HYPO|nr:uncharacterized protein FTJAE_11324 [Fusarium tjaetaba]KAF5621353.1 hypothetical protein FTJAE_11324 [Fusarium tjaetaba]
MSDERWHGQCRLEARLFGQFDGNINPEAGYAMVQIHNELDSRQKLKTHAVIELTQMAQAQRGPWAKVVAAKLQEAWSKRTVQLHDHKVWLSDWDASNDIQKQPANLEKIFFQLQNGLAAPQASPR